METTQSKTCFVISPIGETDSETRKRSDKVLKHIIIPPVEKFGYTTIRADQISEPGIITTQIIQHIVESNLVVADLTERNPNVFYELALRHAIKKPLIQLIKKSEPIPFDVAATRIIPFDIQDLDSVDNAKADIENQLKSIEVGNGEFDNPISVSLELKFLRESGNPEQRSLADIVEAITELRNMVSVIDKRINSPESIVPIEYFDIMLSKISRRRSPDIIEIIDRCFNDLVSIEERLQFYIVENKKIEDKLLNSILERVHMTQRRLDESLFHLKNKKYI